MTLSDPNALEKIFLKLEEESSRRAKGDADQEPGRLINIPESDTHMGLTTPDPDAPRTRKKRRPGSVSISRFGDGGALSLSIPPTPTTRAASPYPYAAPQHPLAALYQAHGPGFHHGSSDSLDSFESDDAPGARTAHQHVTQVHRIAARPLLPRSLTRTLSRSRSQGSVVDAAHPGVVIGVVVEESHHAAEGDGNAPHPTTAAAYGPKRELRGRVSHMTIGGEGAQGWKGRAQKFFEKRFRRRSSTLSSVVGPSS